MSLPVNARVCEWNVNPKVYLGSLDKDTTEDDLRDIFKRYGQVSSEMKEKLVVQLSFFCLVSSLPDPGHPDLQQRVEYVRLRRV